MEIKLAQKEEALEVAKIHKKEIGKGFLSSLPLSFLDKFYQALAVSPASFCLVAKENNEVIGFIAGTTSIGGFYKYFLKNYFFYSCLILLPKILSLKKILETLFYPVKEKDMPAPELLTMAVKSNFQGQGIASKIFSEFVSEMKKRNIPSFKVLVGEELKPAISFYEKNGFKFLKNTKVHANNNSRIYIYDI